MNERDLSVAERFEKNRGRLRGVAYRLLGSTHEADDALQTSWLRLSRAGTDGVENFDAWLTTVVARVCLDMLRSRRSRREEPLDVAGDTVADGIAEPEYEAILNDSVGIAMLVVLERLNPSERVAFVLHDIFDLSFQEIGTIVGKSEAAARQLASRARRKVGGADDGAGGDLARRREVVDAFLAASRNADFTALMRLLAPDVVVYADEEAVRMGAAATLRGADAVARRFAGWAQGAKRAVVAGSPGWIWAPAGRIRVAFDFAVEDGRVVSIHLIANPERLGALELTAID